MPTSWSGYLDEVSARVIKGVDDLQTQVTEALDKLAAKPLDPALLAAYQGKLSEYNLYRNAQSNTIRSLWGYWCSHYSNFRLIRL